MEVWKADNISVTVPFEERKKLLEAQSLTSTDPFKDGICCKQVEMSFMEEKIVVLLWLLFFSLVLFGPFIIIACLLFYTKIGVALITICATVSAYPTAFSKSYALHYLASLNLKYFSFRVIWKNSVDAQDKAYIGVTPPHGLFPFGGILGLFVMPRFAGFWARGAAASAILYYPFVGNFLRAIGCVDASRDVLSHYLRNKETIGKYCKL